MSEQPQASAFARSAMLAYGLLCYVMFLGVFLYACAWVGNIYVSPALDTLPDESTPALPMALLINVGLLSLFAVQHSVMARQWFKRAWTRVIPKAAERSTFVLFTNLVLIAMFIFWQPIGGVIWHVEHPAGRTVLYTLFAIGWLIVLLSTFMINHFDLFGLRQVWLYFKGQPYSYLKFDTPLFYRWVRHPLYLGFMIGFWATPTMTVAHLVFAAATTVYMVLAIQFEERDLVHFHGDDYRSYRKRVAMLFPIPKSKKRA